MTRYLPLQDSGAREVQSNGFTREPDADKPDLSWLFTVRGLELVPRELIERIAEHYDNGARKYSADNWRRGTDPLSLLRYKRSITRHLFAWFRGEGDEDHAAAVAWNLFTYEINAMEAATIRRTSEWQHPDLEIVDGPNGG